MNEIKRWDIAALGNGFTGMKQRDDGAFVRNADHEAEVVRLRAEVEENEKAINVWCGRTKRAEAEVEASRVDAERWDWIMNNYYGGDLARTQKIIGQCWTREQMEAAIDKDLAEHKRAAMGASA